MLHKRFQFRPEEREPENKRAEFFPEPFELDFHIGCLDREDLFSVSSPEEGFPELEEIVPQPWRSLRILSFPGRKVVNSGRVNPGILEFQGEIPDESGRLRKGLLIAGGYLVQLVQDKDEVVLMLLAVSQDFIESEISIFFRGGYPDDEIKVSEKGGNLFEMPGEDAVEIREIVGDQMANPAVPVDLVGLIEKVGWEVSVKRDLIMTIDDDPVRMGPAVGNR